MSDLVNERKVQHINIINTQKDIDRAKGYFDAIQLKHRALPELDLKEIDPSVIFMNKRLSFPLLISSMTGGDHELVRTVNKNCAIAAEATGVAMAVGSQRVMFGNPGAEKSFELRRHAPNTLLFANLGAVQLNYGFDLSHCQRAVDVTGADALYFHLNPLQEAVQPEGDTDFSGLGARIGAIARTINKPVIVKEVGSGISKADAEILINNGIKYIDVAGSGGTSWSRIESFRNSDPHDLGVRFQDWGIPTPLALQALDKYHNDITLVASGGIRNGIDMVKSVILGGLIMRYCQTVFKSRHGIARPGYRHHRESET